MSESTEIAVEPTLPEQCPVESVAVAVSNGNCANSNGFDKIDPMEKFIEVVRPLLSMPEDRKESSINKLRAVIDERVADNPKFREKQFYNSLFEEMLHTIEDHNYLNANTLLKEVIEELKYNVDSLPKLNNVREVKSRIKQIKSLKLKLWNLHKKAEKYLEKEVDLNDENFDEANTAFIKQQLYARKIINLKRRINDLQEKPLRTGLSSEKRYSFNGSEFPQINEAITNLVNGMLIQSHKSKSEQKLRLLAAPDLPTVHQAIVTVKEANNLDIYDIEDYSKKILRKIGQDLKERRRLETEYSIESYLRLDLIKPETFTVPEEEPQLEPKFKEHIEQAVLDTEDIIRKFEEQENAEHVNDFEAGLSQELNNAEANDDEAEDESGSDSESELDDDEKENEEESSSDEEMKEESDDDVLILEETNASTVKEADV